MELLTYCINKNGTDGRMDNPPHNATGHGYCRHQGIKKQINGLKWTGAFYSQYDPLDNAGVIPNPLDQFTTSLNRRDIIEVYR